MSATFDVRDRRLASDYRRVQQLVDGNGLIVLLEAHGEPPERYVVGYRCQGVARVDANDEPEMASTHRVQVVCRRDYPRDRPLCHFQTPLYHPNVDGDNGLICLDFWSVDRFLDGVLVTIGRMIQYRNFNTSNRLHPAAAEWTERNRDRLPVDARPLRSGAPVSGEPRELRESRDARETRIIVRRR